MPQSDPYKAFNFRVKWDGQYVAGVEKVSGLVQRTEVTEYREGGDPDVVRRAAGRTSYDDITLERGVTSDQTFLQWATQSVHENIHKDIVIELFDEAGNAVLGYIVRRCFVVKYEGPALNAESNDVAIERLTLANEGFELLS
jgi:phage tail-like protein